VTRIGRNMRGHMDDFLERNLLLSFDVYWEDSHGEYRRRKAAESSERTAKTKQPKVSTTTARKNHQRITMLPVKSYSQANSKTSLLSDTGKVTNSTIGSARKKNDSFSLDSVTDLRSELGSNSSNL
jgi:hypothetical protein